MLNASSEKTTIKKRRRAIKDYVGKVIEKIRETHDTHTLHIDLGEPLDFKPGQFVMLKPTIDGKSISRAYSISSPPTIKDYIAITVRLGGTFTVSKYLNEVIQVGDTIPVRGPYGKFYWEEGKSDEIVMIAAGSGITPFRSITQYVLDKKLYHVKMKLFYTCRYKNEIIFHDLWEKYDKEVPNFEAHLTITREKPEGWTRHLGRFTAEYFAEHTKDLKNPLYYICGAPAFVRAIMEMLESIGVEEDRILHEDW